MSCACLQGSLASLHSSNLQLTFPFQQQNLATVFPVCFAHSSESYRPSVCPRCTQQLNHRNWPIWLLLADEAKVCAVKLSDSCITGVHCHAGQFYLFLKESPIPLLSHSSVTQTGRNELSILEVGIKNPNLLIYKFVESKLLHQKWSKSRLPVYSLKSSPF